MSAIALLLFLCLSQVCFATDMAVTVWCNDRVVADLQISVYDIEGHTVEGATSTNVDGVFTITNVENYIEPFYLFFNSRRGSTCGAYPVVSNDVGTGSVHLAYYPTSLPCSCAHLLHQ